jgi:hypothetical protein
MVAIGRDEVTLAKVLWAACRVRHAWGCAPEVPLGFARFGGIAWRLDDSISSSFQACVNSQLTTAAQQTKEDPPKLALSITNHAVIYWRCSFHVLYDYRDAVAAVATVFIAIFTLTLWRSTSGLVDAAAKQSADTQAAIAASNRNAVAAEKLAHTAITSNQIAVTNAEQQLRAYVTVQEVSVHVHRHPDRIGTYNDQVVSGNPHTYRFSVILKNGGATPAVNARINISCEKFNGRIPTDFAFPSSQLFGNALIGPQVTWQSPVSAAELQNPAVLAERYLWGWIEYADIFSGSIRHRTEFCFQIIFERLPPTNDGWLRFDPYSRFNAAEQDCLRPIDPGTGEGGG